jgi:hypothetical protein
MPLLRGGSRLAYEHVRDPGSQNGIVVVLRRAGVEIVIIARNAAAGRHSRRRVDLGEIGWIPDLDESCGEVGTADAEGPVTEPGDPG